MATVLSAKPGVVPLDSLFVLHAAGCPPVSTAPTCWNLTRIPKQPYRMLQMPSGISMDHGHCRVLGLPERWKVSDQVWVLGFDGGFGWIPLVYQSGICTLELSVGHSPIPLGAANLDDSAVRGQLQLDAR